MMSTVEDESTSISINTVSDYAGSDHDHLDQLDLDVMIGATSCDDDTYTACMVDEKDDDDLLLDFINEDDDLEVDLRKIDTTSSININDDCCCLTVPQEQEQEQDFTTAGFISPEAVKYKGLYNYNYDGFNAETTTMPSPVEPIPFLLPEEEAEFHEQQHEQQRQQQQQAQQIRATVINDEQYNTLRGIAEDWDQQDAVDPLPLVPPQQQVEEEAIPYVVSSSPSQKEQEQCRRRPTDDELLAWAQVLRYEELKYERNLVFQTKTEVNQLPVPQKEQQQQQEQVDDVIMDVLNRNNNKNDAVEEDFSSSSSDYKYWEGNFKCKEQDIYDAYMKISKLTADIVALVTVTASSASSSSTRDSLSTEIEDADVKRATTKKKKNLTVIKKNKKIISKFKYNKPVLVNNDFGEPIYDENNDNDDEYASLREPTLLTHASFVVGGANNSCDATATTTYDK